MPAYLMPLEELITTYLPFDENIKDWEAQKEAMQGYGSGDASHWATVERLAEELRQDGQFREPVGITPAGLDDEGYGYEYPTVSFGYHRTLAHYITGISPVLVQDSEEYFTEGSRLAEQFPFFLETTVVLDKQIIKDMYAGTDEDYTDVLIESYSFPSTSVPNGWYTPNVASSTEDDLTLVVNLGWEFNQPLYEQEPQTLNAEVVKALEGMLPAGAILSATTYHEPYEED